MEKHFIQVRSGKDKAISFSLLVSGIVLMFLPYGVGCNIGGFFLFLLGGVFLYLLKSVYKEKDGTEIYHKKELMFRRELLDKIQDAVLSNPNRIDTSDEGKGWTIKVSLFYSQKADKGYIQLFEYIPYSYEPCTPMLQYNYNQISNLIK